jgi:hypothetical protein
MSTRQVRAMVSVFLVTGLLLSVVACAPRPYRPRPPVVRPPHPRPPGVVKPPPAVVVPKPPPPPRHEVKPPRPGPGHVWVGGRWVWKGNKHVWTPGRWHVPPKPHAKWVPPHRKRTPRGLRVVPGHWRR